MWPWSESSFQFDDGLSNWLHGQKFVFGRYTRSLLREFERRGIRQDGECWLGPDETRKLLNDMGVFPTKSQILEIIHCSRLRETRYDDFLKPDVVTEERERIYFPEFCILASRLHEGQRKRRFGLRPVSLRFKRQKPQSPSNNIQVFLGGACNPTTWRRDIAIPHLKLHNITFYNPQVPNWTPERIEVENRAKEESQLFLFVISNETRCIASLVEAAFLAGSGRQLLVVMTAPEPPDSGATIQGEPLTQKDYEAMVRSHEFLTDLVERSGLPVFNNIRTALDCTVQVLTQGVSVQDLTRADGVQPVAYSHIAVGYSYIELGEAFDHVDELGVANISVKDALLALRRLGLSADTQSLPSHPNSVLTFPEFCCLFTEYKYGRRGVVDRAVTFIRSLFPGWCSQEEADYPVVRDVFLGGSCGDSTWRADIAIPLLRKHGLSFYNPQTTPWSVRYIPMEANIKHRCRLLLFVITCNTRATAAMLEAAFYIGLGCDVVVCVQCLPDDVVIEGEQLTDAAVKDYNRGRMYFSDLANKAGLPVFDDVTEALQLAITKLKPELPNR